MKTPPLLLAAALLFWGWQAHLLPLAAVLALVLESPRCHKVRWEMSDADITRVWNFCMLLGLAAAIYAFTSNDINKDDGSSNFIKFLANPDSGTIRQAGAASTQAAFALISWLPLVFFGLTAAQAFSTRGEFPLDAISPYLRYRRKRLLRGHRPPPPVYQFNTAWPFFALCLMSAGSHAPEGSSFFWGLCGLVGWALWSRRPRGTAWYFWVLLLAGVIGAGFFGQRGFNQLSRLIDMADNYNPRFLLSWLQRQTADPRRARTSMGDRANLQLSSGIIIRVTPLNGAVAPSYLREATYRNYTPPFWTVGGMPDEFSAVPEDPPESKHWTLHPGQTHRSLVTVSCWLEGKTGGKDSEPTGLLPLPADCDHLENLFAYFLRNNSVGAVSCEGPRLVTYDASFGGGGALDAPPATNSLSGTNNLPAVSEDLAVPKNEQPALDQVIAALPLEGLSDAKKLLAISQYFQKNYEYSLDPAANKKADTNDTALANFLLHTHKGHCEYFATAAVLLLRELHIPARYAVGYYVHEASGHHYVVRQHDAHAWCMAWDATTGTWQTFDATPSSWVTEAGRHTSGGQFFSDLFSWLHFQLARFFYGQNHWRPYLLMGLVPTIGYVFYQIVYHRRRHKPAAAGKPVRGPDWPGLDSEFYLLEQKLSGGGRQRRPGQSLSDWVTEIAGDPDRTDLREPLRQLLRLHYRYRFDPWGLNPAQREELRRQVVECMDALL